MEAVVGLGKDVWFRQVGGPAVFRLDNCMDSSG